jgi:hypothetical protein
LSPRQARRGICPDDKETPRCNSDDRWQLAAFEHLAGEACGAEYRLSQRLACALPASSE